MKTITIDEKDLFRLAAFESSRVILACENEVTVNNKTVDANKEIEIYGNQDYNICLNTDECYSVRLSRW